MPDIHLAHHEPENSPIVFIFAIDTIIAAVFEL